MKVSRIAAGIVLISFLVAGRNSSYADNSNQGSSQNQSNKVSPSYSSPQISSRVTPVVVSNQELTAGPRPTSYTDFLQSPYSKPSSSPNVAGPTVAPNQDPYAASEVSPYAHYSPYMEVVGEGSDYTLGIDDELTVIVRDQPDFSGKLVVDPEGNLQVPFVGDITAVGKTKAQIKKELIERLKRFVRYPEVAVMISEYRSKAVYVMGYVNHPGKYAMKGDKITVKEAIVAAGLPRPDAKLDPIFIIRPSEYTEDGRAHSRRINLNRLLHQGDSASDFLLQPGDTIVINQRFFDKFLDTFERIVGPIFQSVAIYDLATR